MIKLPPPTEETLHKQAARYLEHACPRGGSVMWWHTANGASLAGNKQQRCAQMNKLKSMGLLVGVADLIFVWRCGIGFIELKRSQLGHLNEAQTFFQRWCDRLGIPYEICWSLDSVEQTLRKWNVPLKGSLGGVQ